MKWIERQAETRATAAQVWQIWDNAYLKKRIYDQKQKRKFQVLDVEKGKRLLVQWKALLVRVLLEHEVKPLKRGSVITMRVAFRGFFGPFIGLVIRKRYGRFLEKSLSEFIGRLEGGVS